MNSYLEKIADIPREYAGNNASKKSATISGALGSAIAGMGYTHHQYLATTRSANSSLSEKGRAVGDLRKDFYHYAQNTDNLGGGHVGVGGKYKPELYDEFLNIPRGQRKPFSLADGPDQHHINVGNDVVSPFSGEFRMHVTPTEKDVDGRIAPIITAGRVDKNITRTQFADKVVSESQGFARGIGRSIGEAELQRLHHAAGKIHDAHSTKNALKHILGKNALAVAGLGGVIGAAGYYAANSLHKKAEEQIQAVKKVREVPRPDFSMFQKLPSGSLHEAAGVDSSEKLKTGILRNLATTHEDPMVRARAKLVLDVAKWRRYKQRQQNNAV